MNTAIFIVSEYIVNSFIHLLLFNIQYYKTDMLNKIADEYREEVVGFAFVTQFCADGSMEKLQYSLT
ncbi:MAG: hypothetical protein WC384_23215 [Prolixibacteraceae bacterium]|jgi:hypothetical protein